MKTTHAPFAHAIFQPVPNAQKNFLRIHWLIIFRQHESYFVNHAEEPFTTLSCLQPPTKNTTAVSTIIDEILIEAFFAIILLLLKHLRLLFA
jgi:hypothetical protein